MSSHHHHNINHNNNNSNNNNNTKSSRTRSSSSSSSSNRNRSGGVRSSSTSSGGGGGGVNPNAASGSHNNNISTSGVSLTRGASHNRPWAVDQRAASESNDPLFLEEVTAGNSNSYNNNNNNNNSNSKNLKKFNPSEYFGSVGSSTSSNYTRPTDDIIFVDDTDDLVPIVDVSEDDDTNYYFTQSNHTTASDTPHQHHYQQQQQQVRSSSLSSSGYGHHLLTSSKPSTALSSPIPPPPPPAQQQQRSASLTTTRIGYGEKASALLSSRRATFQSQQDREMSGGGDSLSFLTSTSSEISVTLLDRTAGSSTGMLPTAESSSYQRYLAQRRQQLTADANHSKTTTTTTTTTTLSPTSNSQHAIPIPQQQQQQQQQPQQQRSYSSNNNSRLDATSYSSFKKEGAASNNNITRSVAEKWIADGPNNSRETLTTVDIASSTFSRNRNNNAPSTLPPTSSLSSSNYRSQSDGSRPKQSSSSASAPSSSSRHQRTSGTSTSSNNSYNHVPSTKKESPRVRSSSSDYSGEDLLRQRLAAMAAQGGQQQKQQSSKTSATSSTSQPSVTVDRQQQQQQQQQQQNNELRRPQSEGRSQRGNDKLLNVQSERSGSRRTLSSSTTSASVASSSSTSSSAKMALEIGGMKQDAASRDKRSKRLARQSESDRQLRTSSSSSGGPGARMNDLESHTIHNTTLSSTSATTTTTTKSSNRLSLVSSSQKNEEVAKYLQKRESKKDMNASFSSLTDQQLFQQSHNADVEKYLQRTKLEHNSQPSHRQQQQQQSRSLQRHDKSSRGGGGDDGNEQKQLKDSDEHKSNNTSSLSQQKSTTNVNEDISTNNQNNPSAGLKRSMTSSAPEQGNDDSQRRNMEVPRQQSQRPPPAPLSAPSIFSKSIDLDLRRQAHTTESNLTKREMNASTAAAIAIPTTAIGGNSKVDKYLASRNVHTSPGTILLARNHSSPNLNVTTSNMSHSSEDDSSDDDNDDDHDDDYSDVEKEIIDLTDTSNDFKKTISSKTNSWSVRVCIVSAVDFPASVVPNVPFSPIIKVGLVPFLTTKNDNDTKEVSSSEKQCRDLASIIERSGVASIPKARLHCTSTKILSKRDNGSVEFHEEMRWDCNTHQLPHQSALVVELCSRSVMTPANIKESPPPQVRQNIASTLPSPSNTVGRGSAMPTTASSQQQRQPTTDSTLAGLGSAALGSLFRRPGNNRKVDSVEMEEANAAAVVAKLLVEGEGENSFGASSDLRLTSSNVKATMGGSQQSSELDVKLRRRKKKNRKKAKMTEELRLGSQVIPLSRLSLDKAMSECGETARIEQWFELRPTHTSDDQNAKSATFGRNQPSASSNRNPSILLEISFTTPDRMDDSEDEIDEDDDASAVEELTASFAKRASFKIRKQLKQEVNKMSPEKSALVEKEVVEPVLEPGVIDYLCVVGARDIGDQKDDDGAKGWVNSSPELCILEQFPPNDEFHLKKGRVAVLPNKVEWFCFPEGCKLWRGLTPPNYDELSLKRFSPSSPLQVATSFASFDACLGCTTCFSWFVMASNSEEYGSEMVKTYGAVIRFYVPAPTGIDPTQDDFAQTILSGKNDSNQISSNAFSNVGILGGIGDERKRLWVPIGICLTTSLPIIGAMEVMLLRLCESLAATTISSSQQSSQLKAIHEHIVSLIVSVQKPVRGIVNCSIPFLSGERLQINLPPKNGLPPLPHGNAITSVCRLLGADGLNFLLAAVLTECKILLHSDDVANLCLVAEVMTALIYPFHWALPYIPVLPFGMMEILEAPLSFILGIPTCNLRHVTPNVLEDIVVIDLDRDFSTTEYYEARQAGAKTKTPTPLPAVVASNISKAVYRLIKSEDEIDESTFAAFPSSRSFPRLEAEKVAEREFRLSIALEICGLLRGYDDCVVFSSSQPVFNVDKFLKTAPAMYEEQRGSSSMSSASMNSRLIISPRSRRFLSLLVGCQHFHQFLESLQSDSIGFFHVLMNALNVKVAMGQNTLGGRLLLLESDRTIENLCTTLQKMDEKIPTYEVNLYATSTIDDDVNDLFQSTSDLLFPRDLLRQIVLGSKPLPTVSAVEPAESEGVKHVSLEYLVELEKNPWKYQTLFDVNIDDLAAYQVEKVTLIQALGERKYRAWKLSGGHEKIDTDEFNIISDESRGQLDLSLDLSSLLTSATDDMTSVTSDTLSGNNSVETDSQMTSSERRLADAKDREILRRCLEYAKVSGTPSAGYASFDLGQKLALEAEAALQNPSARQFLLNVLSKRNRQDSSTADSSSNELTPTKRPTHRSGASRLDPGAFEILVRLEWVMLDALVQAKDYSQAYSLLRLSAGLFTSSDDSDSDVLSMSFLTARLGLHPIYADLRLWGKVKDMHARARQENNNLDKGKNDSRDNDDVEDEYEATVTTLYEMLGYGIPAEDLARFASRISEQNGWFHSERGQSLLMLTRRLCIRREQGQGSVASHIKKSDIEIFSPKIMRQADSLIESNRQKTHKVETCLEEWKWVETGWCHPAAHSTRRTNLSDTSTRIGNHAMINRSDGSMVSDSRDMGKYMKRSAITSMAYLGYSVVVTGGLDGGVFMARKVKSLENNDESMHSGEMCDVRGVHLDWGSSGSRYTVGAPSTSLDGEYGVGAVTCLSATHGMNPTHQTTVFSQNNPDSKDVTSPPDDEDIVEAMDGCRVVAGTTCGDLRVWAVKDVFSAVLYAARGGDMFTTNDGRLIHQSAEGASSTFLSSRKRAGSDFAAGSSLTRLKFSLRGRALSGHRGGVSCIDVHSNVYRPDSIVSGGADGLIKLWNLRAPGTQGVRRPTVDSAGKRLLGTPARANSQTNASRSGDALSILSGHGGRILCIKTAWHGDRLLSGGADRTVRLWDVAGSGGKCLNSLSGHLGWVTSVQYWGPNTIVSASTDRSVALWDPRVQSSPLFVLRHHYAPVSDVLVGSRTDPILLSASNDGGVVAWDLRFLAGNTDSVPMQEQPENCKLRRCRVVRNATAKLYSHNFSRKSRLHGPTRLCAGFSRGKKVIFCVGPDSIIREWGAETGVIHSEHPTGHCDAISSFISLQDDNVFDSYAEHDKTEPRTASITTSWDGTVRMRTRQSL